MPAKKKGGNDEGGAAAKPKETKGGTSIKVFERKNYRNF